MLVIKSRTKLDFNSVSFVTVDLESNLFSALHSSVLDIEGVLYQDLEAATMRGCRDVQLHPKAQIHCPKPLVT